MKQTIMNGNEAGNQCDKTGQEDHTMLGEIPVYVIRFSEAHSHGGKIQTSF